MQVAGGKRSYEPGYAAGQRDGIDPGLAVLLGAMADGNTAAVRGQNVVVIAAGNEIGKYLMTLAGLKVKAIDMAAAVISQELSVR